MSTCNINVIDPVSGNTITVSAEKITMTIDSKPYSGLMFIVPTRFPASEELKTCMACDLCHNMDYRDQDGDIPYCKLADIDLTFPNAPCRKYWREGENGPLYPDEYPDLKRKSTAPKLVHDSPIVDWIIENYKLELCFMTDSKGDGTYYIYNGRYFEKDNKLAARRFIENKVKDLYEAYNYQTENVSEKYYEVKGKQEETPEYSAAKYRLKASEKYLDTRKQKDLWDLLRTRLARTISEFDKDKNLLNLENGVYDLNNHVLLPHDPKYNFTMMAPVKLDVTAKGNKFADLYNFQFETEDERRYIRYVFSGSIMRMIRKDCSHIYFFGIPDSGKSTILLTIMKVLGDDENTGYAIQRSPSFNTERAAKKETRNDKLQTRNKCIIGIDETKKGEKQDSESIKNSSGGGADNVRGLYCADEKLDPTATTINTCNELPPFEWEDQALLNRLILVRFNKVLPLIKKDKPFYEVLYQEEASGILNWLLDGVKDYQQNGVPPMPERFKQEIQKYVNENNKIDKYVNEYCKLGDGEKNIEYRMTLQAFMTGLKSYYQNVEFIDEKYIPGQKKIEAILAKKGVVLYKNPKKIKGEIRPFRNVLFGIRKPSDDEVLGFDMEDLKLHEDDIKMELTPKITALINNANHKSMALKDICREFKQFPGDMVKMVCEYLVKTNRLVMDGPYDYALPFDNAKLKVSTTA